MFLVLVTEKEVAQGDFRADVVLYVAIIADLCIK
jgi:hypothetical protein